MTHAPWVLRTGVGGGLLAGSWWVLKLPAVQRGDVRVGDLVRRAQSPAADRLVTLTTDLGSVYAVVGIAAALAVAGRRRAAADVLGIGSVTWNLAQVNKRWVRRQRPYEADVVRRLIRPPTGSSFPSGHAAVGMAVMATLADGTGRAGPRRALHALGAYVGFSRVYAGVHYPTDVVGGAGLGLVLASAWRGPVAAAGRRVIAAGVALGVRILLVAAGRGPRASVLQAPASGDTAVSGGRRWRRYVRARQPRRVVRAGPTRPRATALRTRSGG